MWLILNIFCDRKQHGPTGFKVSLVCIRPESAKRKHARTIDLLLKVSRLHSCLGRFPDCGARAELGSAS